jgi:hypothetical protein
VSARVGSAERYYCGSAAYIPNTSMRGKRVGWAEIHTVVDFFGFWVNSRV